MRLSACGWLLPALLGLGAAHPAKGASGDCVYPDEEVYIRTDCPDFRWSDDAGTPVIRDRGELAWVDDGGRLHVSRRLSDVAEPYRSMYQEGRRQPDGSLTFESGRAPETPASAEDLTVFPYTLGLRNARIARERARLAAQAELYHSLRELMEATLRPHALNANPDVYSHFPLRIILRRQLEDGLSAARGRALRARDTLAAIERP
ncbi:MAG TPA: hypothetical protein VFH51_17930 [Myxococcota bacterium]|nr:hypothetical protein [Myxococcota bacterium]